MKRSEARTALFQHYAAVCQKKAAFIPMSIRWRIRWRRAKSTTRALWSGWAKSNALRLLPCAIRSISAYDPRAADVDSSDVDLSVGIHSLPFLISSMSFGSQGEVAFRAYAEAAFRLNMISLNGEGGEIKDMLGKYPHHRGQQIASGRFGVNAELINSSYLLEIKVGQGAKPGEGGHFPAKKSLRSCCGP